MNRAEAKAAKALADKLAAADPIYRYRAVFVPKEEDEEGPGYVIEAKSTKRAPWHFVGWSEDVKELSGEYHCYGRRIA